MPATIAPCIVPVAGESFVRPSVLGEGIRLYGASSGYVGLKPASVAGSTDYTLPSSPPLVNGQSLVSTTAGVLSWATVTTTPAGSGTELQYRNGGSFGAVAGSGWDGTQLTLPGRTKLAYGDDFTSHLVCNNLKVFAQGYYHANGPRMYVTYLGKVSVPYTGSYTWTRDGGYDASAASDTGLSSTSAGQVEVNNGTAGQYRDLKLRAMYAVAGSATDIPVSITLAAGQSAKALAINNSTGSALTYVDASGNIVINDTTLWQTTGGVSARGRGFFVGDNNAGMWSGDSGAGYVMHLSSRYSGAATPLMTLANGVGINKTSPTALLHLYTGSTAVVGHAIDLASGQSANALNITSYGGTAGDVFNITTAGNVAAKGGLTLLSDQTGRPGTLTVTSDGYDPVITGGLHVHFKNASGRAKISLDYNAYGTVFSTNTTYASAAISANSKTVYLDGYNTGDEWTIKGNGGTGLAVNWAPTPVAILGGSAHPSANTYYSGAAVRIAGGDGSSGYAGSANGGNVLLDGGLAYGTGMNGKLLIGSVNSTNVLIGTTTAVELLTLGGRAFLANQTEPSTPSVVA